MRSLPCRHVCRLCNGSGVVRDGLQVVAADPQRRLANPAPATRPDGRRDVRRGARLDDRRQRLDTGANAGSATGNRGQNRQLGAVRHRRGKPIQEADVLTRQVDVHEAS